MDGEETFLFLSNRRDREPNSGVKGSGANHYPRAATWRLIFLKTFFSDFPRNLVYIGFRGLRVHWHCPFSCATENEAAAAILVLSILINRFHFQLIALKPGIYRVTA